MATIVIIKVQTSIGPVQATIDDSLVWDCDEDGIRQMLQAMVPSADILPETPSNPSRLGETIEYMQTVVPFTIISTITEPAMWSDRLTY